MTCREGHPPRHENFTEGNAVALRHGARSPAVVDPISADIKAHLLATLTEGPHAPAPYLLSPRWSGELDAYCRAEARVQVLLAYEARVGGPLDEQGQPRSYLGELDRAERRAQNARDRLGLNPAAAARLAAYLAATERSQSITAQLEARRREREAVTPMHDERNGS